MLDYFRFVKKIVILSKSEMKQFDLAFIFVLF